MATRRGLLSRLSSSFSALSRAPPTPPLVRVEQATGWQRNPVCRIRHLPWQSRVRGPCEVTATQHSLPACCTGVTFQTATQRAPGPAPTCFRTGAKSHSNRWGPPPGHRRSFPRRPPGATPLLPCANKKTTPRRGLSPSACIFHVSDGDDGPRRCPDTRWRFADRPAGAAMASLPPSRLHALQNEGAAPRDGKRVSARAHSVAQDPAPARLARGGRQVGPPRPGGPWRFGALDRATARSQRRVASRGSRVAFSLAFIRSGQRPPFPPGNAGQEGRSASRKFSDLIWRPSPVWGCRRGGLGEAKR